MGAPPLFSYIGKVKINNVVLDMFDVSCHLNKMYNN